MNPAYLAPLANHLWQSTLFVGAAGLLTLALQNNHARVRHWVWLTASCKFLVPLSVLISLGGHIRWGTAQETTPAGVTVVMDNVSRPFTAPAVSCPLLATVPPAGSPLTAVLWGIWACGFLGIGASWWARWRRIQAAVCAGSPLQLDLPIPARSSPTLLEPGVFGVFRPVLLLPEGIFDRLTPTQLQAVIAHELCHVRHRDNSIAAIQMLVETIFWFHPLVWWIGKRLVEERERACDEEVLRLGSEPRVYAEGILKVCEFYLESPVVCVAGVTGANLKQRIDAIMKNRIKHKLNVGRKLLLATAALMAVAGPLVVGMMNVTPILRAQSTLAFEVVSVKPHKPGEQPFGLPQFLPGGRFSSLGVPLQIIISVAYNLPFQGTQLSGGPDWIRSMDNVYDIEAKADADALKGLSSKDRADKMRLMLQALLAERFKLTMRRDVKQQPVYLLTVDKNGPKLQKSKLEEKDCEDPANRCHFGGAGQGRGIHAKAFDMADLAVSVSNFTDRPLIDRTGLTGLYDIDTDGWVPMRQRPVPPGDPSPESIAMADPTRPTLYMIFDKLGLKMESSKAPVEVFAIDHVEKPTGN